MKKRKIHVPPFIPITVGIVGHRDAVITPRHEELIKTLFADLHAAYPCSPVYLFSQLAEGADSDVADIFLEHKGPKDALIAPVPFELQAYIKSFDNDAHAVRFTEKLSPQAKRQFVLAGEPVSAENQNDLFRMGGKFVADSSLILLVLWNGIRNNKVGGAADIVHYKENGAFNDDDLRNIYEKPSTILDLRCNRKAGEQITVTYPEKSLLETVKGDKTIKQALIKIEELNGAAISTTEEDIEQSLKYLLEKRDKLAAEDTDLAACYCLTDDQAMKNQKKYFRCVTALFILGFTIIAVFEIYKHMFQGPFSLTIALGFIASALCLSWYSKKKEFHMRFLAARVLAESLRVQFFWNLVGLRENAGDYILRIYKKEYDWIKYILNSIYGITYPAKDAWYPEVVRDHWLELQLQYFKKNIDKMERKRKYLNNWALISLYLALMTLVFMLCFHHCLKHTELFGHELLDYLIIISGCFLGMFALLKAYIEKKGFHQLVNQDTLMRDVHQSTLDRLKTVGGPNAVEATKKLFKQAGEEALIENGNWYMIYKDKEPNVEGIG